MLQNNYPDSLYFLACKNRLSHAIIIEDEDIEKSYSVAMQLAKMSLCMYPDDPCNSCPNCVKLNNASHPDVKVILPQGNSQVIKIDDIRFIRESSYVVSNEGRFKFYIIKNADTMTIQAQNALIKILEEPPENVVFVLLCKSLSTLLVTVRSRSQIFKGSSNTVYDCQKYELAKKIVLSSINGDKCAIIEYMDSVPNDRIFLKNLVELIIEQLLRLYASREYSCLTYEVFIERVENLKEIIDSIEKNVNFNLLTCYLCACM